MASLPLWLQIIGLVAALLWPCYQLLRALKGPKLEVKLTKDLFFRFIDLGECLFIRPVLIAEHGNVLIKKVHARLKRTEAGVSKDWELEFLKFGEIMTESKSIEPNFYFQSSSPSKFLSKGVPVQAVYLARATQYGTEYANIIKKLKENLIQIKSEETQPISNNNDDQQRKLNEKIKSLSANYANEIFDKIQLEAGKYEINIQITYRGISGLGAYFDRKTQTSKLSFEVEKNAREQIKLVLPRAVLINAVNYIFNSDLIGGYPEYVPVNIQEDIIV